MAPLPAKYQFKGSAAEAKPKAATKKKAAKKDAPDES
tara:strand:+ start:43 stop:153 length:111 start_codon:yes stop_codon:yes gene_type:complete